MPDRTLRELHKVREIRRNGTLFAAARVPRTDRLLLGSSEGKVLEVNAGQDNGEFRELANHGRYVTSVRLVGDNTVVSGGYDGRLMWWDLRGNRLVRTIDNAHSRYVRMIAVSPDGSKIASVADDMVCWLWNAASGEKIREMRGHAEQTPTHFSSMLYCCAFSPDGRLLATGDRVGHVVIWEVSSGRQVKTLEVPVLYTWDGRQRIRSIGGIRGLAFSPNGAHLAVGGVGQIGNVDALQGPATVEVFDWNRGERVYRFTGPNGIINCLAYHPQNHWLAAIGGGGNGIALFYDPTRRTMIHQGNLPMHTRDIAFNEDFSKLYAVDHNRIAVMELRG